MASVPPEAVWGRLSRDPRNPQDARLRASDGDRDVVHALLSEAYADGRLDKAEYDQRAEAVWDAKLLGDLVPVVSDLVPADVPTSARLLNQPEIEAKANRKWRRDLRHRSRTFASVSLLTSGIWGATAVASQDVYFFWPVFPIVGTGIGLASTLLNKGERIESERERIEAKQHKKLKQSRKAKPKPHKPPKPE
ncbi:MAG: DUF1707 SHOCT-like domain-containing protein [Nocardioidaceae bacterium]